LAKKGVQMNRIFLFALMGWMLVPCLLYSQETKNNNEVYQFTDEIVLPVTPVKNQNRTGTCWSFSTLSFLESEMLRLKKQETDL